MAPTWGASAPFVGLQFGVFSLWRETLYKALQTRVTGLVGLGGHSWGSLPLTLKVTFWLVRFGFDLVTLVWLGSQVVLVVKNPLANTDAWDAGLIPGWGRRPGEGHGNPLQYSCLGNPMDRGAFGLLQSMGSQRVGHDWSGLAQTCSKKLVCSLKKKSDYIPSLHNILQ